MTLTATDPNPPPQSTAPHGVAESRGLFDKEILKEAPQERQTALFSATMPPRIAALARDYLKANLGRVASRNGAFAPWTDRIDLRMTKDIRTVRGQSMAIADRLVGVISWIRKYVSV